jgi:hypothetical protein
MNYISNSDQFKNYKGKYIDIFINDIYRKYYVSEIQSGSITTDVNILYNDTFSIIGNSLLQKCENKNYISWSRSFGGTLSGNPWRITNSGRDVAFYIEDSYNCGGSNSYTQYGTAIATISVGVYPIYMTFAFTGNVEQHDTEFENMSFLLNDVLLTSATSQDLNLNCTMGLPISTTYFEPPYLLSAAKVNEFKITFTTGDGRFHKDAYYKINLGFFYNSALTIPVAEF